MTKERCWRGKADDSRRQYGCKPETKTMGHVQGRVVECLQLQEKHYAAETGGSKEDRNPGKPQALLKQAP